MREEDFTVFSANLALAAHRLRQSCLIESKEFGKGPKGVLWIRSASAQSLAPDTLTH
jgi:hypothetical protein